jgi:hypothetical protein
VGLGRLDSGVFFRLMAARDCFRRFCSGFNGETGIATDGAQGMDGRIDFHINSGDWEGCDWLCFFYRGILESQMF